MLSKLKNNLLSLNHLRKFVGSEILYNAVKSKFQLKTAEISKNQKVLVLAPHPDDDVFGCAGTIKLHRLKNHQVKIIYFSKNSEREKEAAKAAAVLGADDLVFLNNCDGKIKSDNNNVFILEKIIADFAPDLIFVPSFCDPHPDHFAVCEILYKTLQQNNFTADIWSYEIWSPIFANRLVCIDEVIDDKKTAIKMHYSQLKNRNYLNAFIGLAQYRAGMFNAGNYAEAFFSCNKQLYLKLFKLTKI